MPKTQTKREHRPRAGHDRSRRQAADVDRPQLTSPRRDAAQAAPTSLVTTAVVVDADGYRESLGPAYPTSSAGQR
jgi:hypothetical protein